MTFLIQKTTKQDKETIVKRAKEVPESDKTVCRETELVRGYEAQDWGGARVFCSFADTVALMFWVSYQRAVLHFPIIFRNFLFVATKKLRKSVRKNSVQINTDSTFSEFHAHFITVNHQTKLVSVLNGPQNWGPKKYGLPASRRKTFTAKPRARNTVNTSLLLRKMVS